MIFKSSSSVHQAQTYTDKTPIHIKKIENFQFLKITPILEGVLIYFLVFSSKVNLRELEKQV